MTDEQMNNIEFTDRYKALGIPYPDPKTMCHGPCEGTGFVPIGPDDADPVYRALAEDQHLSRCDRYARTGEECDGWHFVRCQVCKGTGIAP